MNVYLVEDCGNVPGLIYALFAHEDDAQLFADALDEQVTIETRHLFYGQPPIQGYNP